MVPNEWHWAKYIPKKKKKSHKKKKHTKKTHHTFRQKSRCPLVFLIWT